jgi:hypothetical protein
MTSFPSGRIVRATVPLAEEAGEISCWICGRPLQPDEDFGQWRLRVVRPSPRYRFAFQAICPSHYDEGPR